MEVRIGFSKRNMCFSKFLQWVEKRPYSHCYVRYRNHVTGQDLILHAAGLSVSMVTLDNFKKHGNEIVKEYIYDVQDKTDIKNILTFIFQQVGTPYGWIQLFGMCIVKVCAFFGKNIANPLGDKEKTMVCSEFCAHVVKIGRIAEIDIDYAEKGGPSWIDKQLETNAIPHLDP